jgi:cell division protein FtsB
MRREKSQSWVKKFFTSRYFLLVFSGILLIILVGYVRAYYQDYKIKQEIKQLEAEVKTLETKKIESLEILQYVTSEDFVEEKARTELNLRKPGENMVIINREENAFESDSTDLESSQHLNNPTKWWYYFVKGEGVEPGKLIN